ncbi:hypothetical protein SDC9_52060 [bioreactor metagenome]|uniref:Type II secretion system protein GspF domain-containing protein n=1 Tax=bioreactor metagenome TaxID=1076179 RepID=A0A644WPG2_9ZZZZ
MTGFIALAWGALIFSLILLSLGAYGERRDLVSRRVSSVLNNSQKVNILDEELSKPLSERLIKPLLKAFFSKIEKYAIKNSNTESNTKKQKSNKLKKMLHQAGMSISVSEYSFIRLIVIVSTAALFGIISIAVGLSMRSVLGVVFGIYVGYTVVRFQLASKISKRRRSMEKQLPDVLDLLSVNVEAGLGFEQALLHVIGHFEGPIIDELTITYREMTMGRPRREALILLAERCDLNEVKTFTGSIVQAEQLGISIKNVLRTQATAMRTNRRNKVEEKAMKISVKILLPMVGFIFPVLLIVLMGPAAMKIISIF